MQLTPKLVERFWAKVPAGGLLDCWEWQGNRNVGRGGYGQLSVWPNTYLAHRIAYALTKGPIPAGLFVLHRCDNPPCVNPAHLWLGTARDNSADMVAKGRAASGDRHPMVYRPELRRPGELNSSARITAADVREIRERFARGESQRVLAIEFGLTKSYLGQITRGERWKHLEVRKRAEEGRLPVKVWTEVWR